MGWECGEWGNVGNGVEMWRIRAGMRGIRVGMRGIGSGYVERDKN